MTTIAKTKRYQELTYRHLKLLQLYSVMSELRLHTNQAVNRTTAAYYHNKLYTWGDYGSFLTASLESMMQVFYIELDGFIGGYWSKENQRVQRRDNDPGSLASYLYDGTRKDRKKSAQKAFESLLKDEASELTRIHNTRHKLAHFKELTDRNSALVPGGVETRAILDKLSETLYLLGFQRWNKPHYIEQDNNSTSSTQKIIDALIGSDDEAKAMRKDYITSRDSWFSK